MSLECYKVLVNKLDTMSIPTKDATLVFYERFAFIEIALRVISLEDDLKLLD